MMTLVNRLPEKGSGGPTKKKCIILCCGEVGPFLKEVFLGAREVRL